MKSINLKWQENQKKYTPKDKIVENYYKDINKISTFFDEKKQASLLESLRKGDGSVIEELVEGNLRFVVSIAKTYQNRGLPLSDLISEGNLGLIKAAKKFDESLGFKFITYAVRWIRQCILKAINDNKNVLYYPDNFKAGYSKVNESISNLTQILERDPTDLEISGATGIDPDKVRYIRLFSTPIKSLDAPINDKNANTLIETYPNKEKSPDFELVHVEHLKRSIQNILLYVKNKDDRKFRIIDMYFLKKLTLQEIGDELLLSRERVRQIKDKTLIELRTEFSDQYNYL